MIKIFVVTPNADAEPTPQEYYRTLGPLLADPREYAATRISAQHLGWQHLAQADIVAFTCPTTQAELRAMELAKAAGARTWVDYGDENLFDLPSSHPRHEESTQDGFRDALLTALLEADLVTVATESLREVYQLGRTAGSAVEVVADGLPAFFRRASTLSRSDTFGWTGGPESLRDCLAFGYELARSIPETARLSVHGFLAWPLMDPLLERGVECLYTRPLPLPLHYKCLVESAVTLFLVPKEDTEYARGLSNRPWLEATAAGALTLAPNWPAYQVAGIRHYSDETSFGAEVANHMEIPYDERARLWEAAQLAALEQTLVAEARRLSLLTLLVAPVTPPAAPPSGPARIPQSRGFVESTVH